MTDQCHGSILATQLRGRVIVALCSSDDLTENWVEAECTCCSGGRVFIDRTSSCHQESLRCVTSYREPQACRSRVCIPATTDTGLQRTTRSIIVRFSANFFLGILTRMLLPILRTHKPKEGCNGNDISTTS